MLLNRVHAPYLVCVCRRAGQYISRQHGSVGEHSHFLVHDDTVALGRMVYAVPDVGQSVEGALQMIALETQIPLAHDDDFAVLVCTRCPQAQDVPLDQGELFLHVLRVCESLYNREQRTLSRAQHSLSLSP